MDWLSRSCPLCRTYTQKSVPLISVSISTLSRGDCSSTQNLPMALSESKAANRSLWAAGPRRIHWRVPTLMCLSFVAAIISAVSHHVLYSSLDGRAITDDFEQQVVTSAGSALAFLVKVLLAISSSLAFIQCLWFSLRSRSVKIRTMDALFGILGNPLEFLDLRFWLGHPVLFLTAMTTW
jgi:hypothetical protein